MAVYFTADTHFGHAAARALFRRPFPSVAAMDEAMILYTTWPDAETAQAAGAAAVETGLAACVNVFAPMMQ